MFAPRRIEVACTVEIEQTQEFLHAHAIPEGIDIRPGDRVIVHNPPTSVPFGQSIAVPCRATVIRAGWLARAWTHVAGLFELTELYEVGFQPADGCSALSRKELS